MSNTLIDDMIRFGSQRNSLSRWQSLFKQQLKLWKFNKDARDAMYQWGSYGYNWGKLHKSDDEQSWTQDQWLSEFYREVHYCSDRMSMDRLLRCHWLYNQCKDGECDE